MLVEILISFVLGLLLAGVWFGVTVAVQWGLSKYNFNYLLRFRGVIAAFIPVCVIMKLNACYFMNLRMLLNLKMWCVTVGVVLLTSMIASRNVEENPPKGRELAWKAADGAFMEVPQRLMMQSFMWYLLKQSGIERAAFVAIFVNALIWCCSILIQNAIFKIKFSKTVWIELAASFAFSMGIGYVLMETECIIFTMTAHALERVLCAKMREI